MAEVAGVACGLGSSSPEPGRRRQLDSPDRAHASAAYYSVPLYRLFCQATRLGGTTQVAREALERYLRDHHLAALPSLAAR
jgi:hypothetical protein